MLTPSQAQAVLRRMTWPEGTLPPAVHMGMNGFHHTVQLRQGAHVVTACATSPERALAGALGGWLQERGLLEQVQPPDLAN